ncbi:MAG: LacI family DNA-binding transcriptional regulator [Planctomycetota bacterium]
MTAPATLEPSTTLTGQSRILSTVRGWIDRGSIGRGEPLPTMRTLASDFNVDKGTVCRALAVLQGDGLVERIGRRLHVSEERAIRRPTAEVSGVVADTIVVLTAASYADRNRGPRGWATEIIDGLLSTAHRQGRHVMLVNPASANGDALKPLLALNTLGVLVIGTHQTPDEYAAMLRMIDDSGVPATLFGEEVHSDGHDMVTGDHAAGAEMLTHWLADRGCRRVLRYWPYRIDRIARPPWLGHRDEGYVIAVRERGLPELESVEPARPDLPGFEGRALFEMRVRETVGHLIEHVTGDDRVDAILTPTDSLAHEVAAALRLLRLEPNRDVLIAGYDGSGPHCPEREFEPVGPAVSVTQDGAGLGAAIVDTLLERRLHPDRPTVLRQLKPTLVEAPPWRPPAGSRHANGR